MKGYLSMVATRALAPNLGPSAGVQPAVRTASPLVAFDQRLALAGAGGELDAGIGNPDTDLADPLAEALPPPATMSEGSRFAPEPFASGPLTAPVSAASTPGTTPFESTPAQPAARLAPFPPLSTSRSAVAPLSSSPAVAQHFADHAGSQPSSPVLAPSPLTEPAFAGPRSSPANAPSPATSSHHAAVARPMEPSHVPLHSQPIAAPPAAAHASREGARLPLMSTTEVNAPERMSPKPTPTSAPLDFTNALGKALSSVNRWMATPARERDDAPLAAATPAAPSPAAVLAPEARSVVAQAAEVAMFRAQHASPQLVIGRVTVNVVPPPKVAVQERSERRRPFRHEAPAPSNGLSSKPSFGMRQR